MNPTPCLSFKFRPHTLNTLSDNFFEENYLTLEDKISMLDPDMNKTHNPTSRKNVGLEFRTAVKDTYLEDSEACSPPLWPTSPSRNVDDARKHHRNLSPASRTQAIARGQQELMEMLKTMPEPYYELSLRDLVEQPLVGAHQKMIEPEKSKFDDKPQMKRSGNLESGGLYLKMAFPIGSKKKKKKNHTSHHVVSPVSSVSDGSAWWRKSFSGSMNKGRIKSNSRIYSRYENGGCWSFICKRKPQVHHDN